jgi:hypothetical protein
MWKEQITTESTEFTEKRGAGKHEPTNKEP